MGNGAVSAGYRDGEQAVRWCWPTWRATSERMHRRTGEALVTSASYGARMAVLGRNYARARLTSEHARAPVAVAARPTPELLPNAVYPLW